MIAINPDLKPSRKKPQEPRTAREAVYRPVTTHRPPDRRGGSVQPQKFNPESTWDRVSLIQRSPVTRGLSPSCREVAIAAALHARPDLFASVVFLVEQTGLTKRTVHKALRSLEGVGFIISDSWKHHGSSWTRKRTLNWEALMGGVQADTEEGVQADTEGDVQADTRKQQALDELRLDELREEEEVGSEGDPSVGTPTPQDRPETVTGNGSPGADLPGKLATQGKVQSLGVSEPMAAWTISMIGVGPALDICRTVQERVKTGTVANPPGLFVALSKDKHPEIWKERGDRLRDRAGFVQKAGMRGRSPVIRKAHSSGCTCEGCFTRRTGEWV